MGKPDPLEILEFRAVVLFKSEPQTLIVTRDNKLFAIHVGADEGYTEGQEVIFVKMRKDIADIAFVTHPILQAVMSDILLWTLRDQMVRGPYIETILRQAMEDYSEPGD